MSERELPAETGPLMLSSAANTENSVWFSLVIPTYNERENLENIVSRVSTVLDENYKGRYEIVFADDDSPDGTAAKALELSSHYPQIKVMLRKTERGLATAVVRGWQVCSGEILGVMDGDLQHPPELLIDLLKRIEAGADLVLATRYDNTGGFGKWGLLRRLNSQFATVLAELLLPEILKGVSDPMSGCFVFRRTCIDGIILAPRGYKILLELLARGRFKKIEESSYVFRLRERGKTKLSWKQYAEYLQQLLELRLHLWRRGS